MKLVQAFDQQDIRNYSYEELVAYLATIGEKPFRAEQIFEWIYKKGASNFNAMKNLPKPLKAHLQKDFTFTSAQVVKNLVSEDKTKKFLFDLADREKVETVLIPTTNRATGSSSFGAISCSAG